jgi:hypothetical protein
MIKLLITIITWLSVSSGLVGVPSWLAAPEAADQPAKTAADVYCDRGQWPDRERACLRDSRPAATLFEPQGVEKLVHFDRVAGGVRFYDASREAVPVAVAPTGAPQAPATYSLSGTTTAIEPPLTRTVQIMPSAGVTADERLPAAAAPAAVRDHRATLYRPAHTRRPPETRRRLANNADQRHSPMMRIYGVAF